MTLPKAQPPLPPQLFFTTPQQRLALARQRYFEEGVRPSGLVSEGVIQSWARCLQAHRRPDEAVTFNAVTTSRVHSALARSRQLLQAAASELNQLEAILAGTTCSAILTDPQGVVVHAMCFGQSHEHVLMPLATRIGVNLAEDCIGTNAPGVTAHTGQPSLVLGGEHFFGCVQVMHCAAAPIRDVNGQVAGVLDVSSESRPFGFDAAAVVGMYATAIENRLLRAQSHEHIVVQLQTSPALLDTPMEGLAGIAPDGSLAWLNGAAARLLGLPQLGPWGMAADLLALDLAALRAATRQREPLARRMPSGLLLWLRAHLQAPDGSGPLFAAAQPAPTPAAANLPAASATPIVLPAAAETAQTTLRNAGQNLIEQTLADCAGNVSKAARQLGVSRGLIYRHLRGGADPG